jgi:hypothetical protein
MSMSRCILLDHTHIGDRHIPSFVDSIRLVLHDFEHVTLHNPRSCPHWRFLRRFNSLSTRWSWACRVAYSSIKTTLEINTSLPSTIRFANYYIIISTLHCILLDDAHIGDQHIPSFVYSIHLVLHDHEHVTLHTARSCPHWRSTHPLLHRFDSPSTTWP